MQIEPKRLATLLTVNSSSFAPTRERAIRGRPGSPTRSNGFRSLARWGWVGRRSSVYGSAATVFWILGFALAISSQSLAAGPTATGVGFVTHAWYRPDGSLYCSTSGPYHFSYEPATDHGTVQGTGGACLPIGGSSFQAVIELNYLPGDCSVEESGTIRCGWDLSSSNSSLMFSPDGVFRLEYGNERINWTLVAEGVLSRVMD